jgi:hypothetical protein
MQTSDNRLSRPDLGRSRGLARPLYEPEGRKLKGIGTIDEGRGDPLGLRLWRISWLIFLIGQGVLATAWWWLAPGGFGPGHPRFWLNRVAAPTVAIGVIATLWALRRERWRPLRLLLAAWPAAWAAMALVLRSLFPITMTGLWLMPFVMAAGMGFAAIRPWRTGTIGRRWLGGLAATVCGSALAGAATAAALRPPAADTHLLNVSIATEGPADTPRGRIQPGSLQLDAGATIQTSDGSLMARVRPITIQVKPLLTFLSRSPDGSPVVLVPERERAGPEPRLRDGWRIGERSCCLAYHFPGQGPATLRAAGEPDSGAIALEAATRLDGPVFSHLNSFCDVEIRGHRRLALEFSPCPGALIEVRHFGYPAGRPVRFAFVSADRTFRVVEASSGEKGPFRTLARGRLEPEQALTITIHDDGRAVARISLDDFSAQADTSLSPTAGWGVPVNAIEFSLADVTPSSPASVFVTLAGTSVGRGWDCVGHRAGTYRNRMRLEPVRGAEETGSR